MTVIVGAGLVLSHELLDMEGVEESVARQIRRAQEFVHQRVPLVVQPVLHWHAEALLAPLENLLGQSRGKRFTQNPFPHPPAHLQIGGNRQREVDDFVVEIGHPGFQRAGHTHRIDLGEDVFRQVEAQITLHLGTETVRIPGLSRRALAQARKDELAGLILNGGTKLRPIQLRATLRLQENHPTHMLPTRRQSRAFEKAANLVANAALARA